MLRLFFMLPLIVLLEAEGQTSPARYFPRDSSFYFFGMPIPHVQKTAWVVKTAFQQTTLLWNPANQPTPDYRKQDPPIEVKSRAEIEAISSQIVDSVKWKAVCQNIHRVFLDSYLVYVWGRWCIPERYTLESLMNDPQVCGIEWHNGNYDPSAEGGVFYWTKTHGIVLWGALTRFD